MPTTMPLLMVSTELPNGVKVIVSVVHSLPYCFDYNVFISILHNGGQWETISMVIGYSYGNRNDNVFLLLV